MWQRVGRIYKLSDRYLWDKFMPNLDTHIVFKLVSNDYSNSRIKIFLFYIIHIKII